VCSPGGVGARGPEVDTAAFFLTLGMGFGVLAGKATGWEDEGLGVALDFAVSFSDISRFLLSASF